jgi:hypothetical protein
MRTIEYASLAELQRRDVDTNGCDHQAGAELRRRGLDAKLGGAGRRTPAELLAHLEARKNGPTTVQEKLIATYARCRHTRDPREAMLALRAMRISQDW